VGKDGVITVEESKSADTVLDVVEGMPVRPGLSVAVFCDGSRADGVRAGGRSHSDPREKISVMRTCCRCWSSGAVGKPFLVVAED